MFSRLYFLFVLFYDVVHLIIGSAYAILESLFQFAKPPKMKSLEGEIALIVCASGGIGREFAVQLAALGVEVICWGVDEEDILEAAREAKAINDNTGKAHSYLCDLMDRNKVLQTAQRIKKEIGEVTILINCCNIPTPETLSACVTQEIRKTMDVSIMSHFWLLESFLPSMIDGNNGHIVALSSVAGLTGVKNQAALCASQFAVQGLVESLSEELRVNRCNGIHITLAHIYPLVVSHQLTSKTPFRILPRKVSIMFRELLDVGVDF
uniref:Uncharacterized protein n=2 Tax=Timema TaxID=61471 RepID=A0A7R9AWI7_TIMSH|nr:unnamed protein product [Timema shepardi]CAD7570237.1 unnamed protein product [Timema californicum]